MLLKTCNYISTIKKSPKEWRDTHSPEPRKATMAFTRTNNPHMTVLIDGPVGLSACEGAPLPFLTKLCFPILCWDWLGKAEFSNGSL